MVRGAVHPTIRREIGWYRFCRINPFWNDPTYEVDMFVLETDEFSHWRSQFVISKEDRKGLRYAPMAFTEQGVAMLSSVLNSPRAVQVNIAIMRIFVRLREIMTTHDELARKIEEMEKKYDSQFRVVFEAIRELIESPEPKRKGQMIFRRIRFTG